MTLHISEPVPGYYRRKLVKRGPWVPVVVFRPCPIEWWLDGCQALDRWPHLACLVDGQPANPIDNWPYLEPISEREYRWMRDAAEWDRRYDHLAPAANPRRAVDLDRMQPIF